MTTKMGGKIKVAFIQLVATDVAKITVLYAMTITFVTAAVSLISHLCDLQY